MLHRFRRIIGVRVDGLTGRIVLGAGTTSQWWLVGLAAVIGGVG